MQDILMTNWVCPKCWLLVNLSIHFIYTYIYWSDFVFLVHIQLNSFHGKKQHFAFSKCWLFFISDHWCHRESQLIKSPNQPTLNTRLLYFPPRVSLLPPVVFIPGVRQPRLASPRRQIDIWWIDISCSGPRNHFHFTLCCTGKIRHLR